MPLYYPNGRAATTPSIAGKGRSDVAYRQRCAARLRPDPARGFAGGRTIYYYELGVVKVAPGNEVLPIWTFTDGVAGQRNVADLVPGKTAYPPLWAIVEVTWKSGV
jgi:hypothetical protein